MKKLIGYRAYEALRDNNGNIVHKTLIGFAKTLKGVRALYVNGGRLTPVVVEKVYQNNFEEVTKR